jgi:hypothetical protein
MDGRVAEEGAFRQDMARIRVHARADAERAAIVERNRAVVRAQRAARRAKLFRPAIAIVATITGGLVAWRSRPNQGPTV